MLLLTQQLFPILIVVRIHLSRLGLIFDLALKIVCEYLGDTHQAQNISLNQINRSSEQFPKGLYA